MFTPVSRDSSPIDICPISFAREAVIGAPDTAP
jgi:hypothetical protein